MELPIDMQHQAMGYDRAANMYSPEGLLLQVEYAEKTVKLGSSSIGMVCSDGGFILADRRITDKLVTPKSANKIYEIDEHIITSVAGIVSDARILIEKARVLAQQHRVTYDSPIEIELVIKEISDIKQMSTQYAGVRPFGASLMIAGISDGKAELYTSEITGNYYSYQANAIGENDDKIKEKLKEQYNPELTIKQGVEIALKIFEEILGKDFDIERFELCVLNSDGKLEKVEGEKIGDYGK